MQQQFTIHMVAEMQTHSLLQCSRKLKKCRKSWTGITQNKKRWLFWLHTKCYAFWYYI